MKTKDYADKCKENTPMNKCLENNNRMVSKIGKMGTRRDSA